MPFTFLDTPIKDLIVIEPKVFRDGRGFFLEAYKKPEFASHGIDVDFLQDNHSYSQYGVLRGLHFQVPPYAQGKLVSCVQGSVWDVAVDLREYSPTFTRWYGLELSSDNHKMMYIPPGFAHGFLVLSKNAQFQYKCTEIYNKDAERGILWNDPVLEIAWPIGCSDLNISDKDLELPAFKELF